MHRICQLISGDLWAGAEVMTGHLLRGLQDSSHIELTSILLNDGRLAEELKGAGVRMIVVDESRHTFLQLSRMIRRELRIIRPNILHAHRYKENLLSFIASRGLHTVRLVSTQHGLPEDHGMPHPLSTRIKLKANYWVLVRKFDRVVAVSEDIQRFFVQDLGMEKAKVAVIHNGIGIPLALSKRGSDAPFVVGSSGRLFPVKDYGLMVSIAQELLGVGKIVFSLAGEGPEWVGLGESIRARNLADTFELKGHVDDMDSFYSGLDVYLNTSIHEGIPMSILEAMAWGLPVVAPRVGGIPEIITDGEEGFLIEGRDPKDFAEKIRLLKHNPDLRRRMGAKAREKVERCFSVQAMTEGYLRLYRELMEEKR
jgi:L-malate glycosyltransferase